MKLTVVIPVFNAKDAILEAIEETGRLNAEKEIVVVDNCSTDGTREILRKLNDNSVKIVYQSENFGYGAAVLAGMNLAGGDYLYIQHPETGDDPVGIYEMLKVAQAEDLDIVLGSCSSRDSCVTTLLNVLFEKRFTDVTGKRLYKTSTLKLMNIRSQKSGFDFEAVAKACKHNLKVKEVRLGCKPGGGGKRLRAKGVFCGLWAILKVKLCG